MSNPRTDSPRVRYTPPQHSPTSPVQASLESQTPNENSSESTPTTDLGSRRSPEPSTYQSGLVASNRSSQGLAARALLDVALRAAVDQKSFDVRGLDVTGIATFTDFFLIASGTSPRHVQGVADKIITALRHVGAKPFAITGHDNGEWIVLDYGDFVAHLFFEPTRQFYEFDSLWSSAPIVALDPDLAEETRALRTGRFR